MSDVTVYRFTIYDIKSDTSVPSRRWGTREGIGARRGVVLEDTRIAVDASFVGGEEEGLTVRDFDPRPRTGFQTKVEPDMRRV